MKRRSTIAIAAVCLGSMLGAARVNAAKSEKAPVQQGGGHEVEYENGYDSVPDVEPDSKEAMTAGAADELRRAAMDLHALDAPPGLVESLLQAAEGIDPTQKADTEGLTEGDAKAFGELSTDGLSQETPEPSFEAIVVDLESAEQVNKTAAITKAIQAVKASEK